MLYYPSEARTCNSLNRKFKALYKLETPPVLQLTKVQNECGKVSKKRWIFLIERVLLMTEVAILMRRKKVPREQIIMPKG